jgi:hypothetical protein
MLRGRVVHRQLFALPDGAQGKEKNTAVARLAETIRLARMIYVSSRIPTTAGIDAPVIVHLTNTQFATARDSPSRFCIRNPFAQELRHFLARRQAVRRKTALSIDGRFAHQ